MKIAQYVETFGYVGMFNTMNFASYICLYLISPFMQHPVYQYLLMSKLKNSTVYSLQLEQLLRLWSFSQNISSPISLGLFEGQNECKYFQKPPPQLRM